MRALHLSSESPAFLRRAIAADSIYGSLNLIPEAPVDVGQELPRNVLIVQ